MKAIVFPAACRPLPFYLAAEEWAARCLPAGHDYFMAWQVNPTVICGRHQDMTSEVDLSYAGANGIEVWRRKSGGGCVYADNNNVMFSYITAETGGTEGSFGRYTSLICGMLGALGLEAHPTGRNDVAIDGRKVAGNALYRTAGRSIVHGTMLYDADPVTMGRVLTPSRAKLESKGVQSVPARITTLRACGLQISCPEFVQHAISWLCTDGSIMPDETDMAAINDIMQSYLRPDFLRREQSEQMDVERSSRVDGAGEIRVSMSLSDDGRIDRLRLSGDFLTTKDIDTAIIAPLHGLPPDAGAVADAIRESGGADAIRGIDADTLADLICGTSYNRPNK